MTRKTPFKVQLGERIKFYRKKAGLTQEELSLKLGVLQSTIANYESGYSQPDNEFMKKIASILNVSSDHLLGNTTIINPKSHLENILSEYYLTETEYDMLISDLVNNQNIHLNILNSTEDKKMSKIQKAYKEILEVYMDYLESRAVTNETDDSEFIKDYNKIIDKDFISLLKSLNKEKITFKESSNVFPTIDIPKQYPVLGKISAGLPILAIENIERYEFVPSSYIKEGYEYFYLRVQGDSMNLKFPNGCLLLIQRQPTLENGQIGVFRINGDDVTVKRFKEENNLIILEPMSTNPKHHVQTYNPQAISVEIIGKVVFYIGDIN